MKIAAARTRRAGERGFTLVEMLLATVIVLVGLVAVAEMVPRSVLMNSNSRNDAKALVMAQKEVEALRNQPLTTSTFSDPLGVVCPLGSTCNLGDSSQPGVVGSPVVLGGNGPMIDFTAAQVNGYGFTFKDPNDPFGASNDVRWAVITTTSGSAVTGRRIIVGVFRRGMITPSSPVTLDTQVLK